MGGNLVPENSTYDPRLLLQLPSAAAPMVVAENDVTVAMEDRTILFRPRICVSSSKVLIIFNRMLGIDMEPVVEEEGHSVRFRVYWPAVQPQDWPAAITNIVPITEVAKEWQDEFVVTLPAEIRVQPSLTWIPFPPDTREQGKITVPSIWMGVVCDRYLGEESAGYAGPRQHF